MSKKKIIVITGASDGIGAAAARQLHANGHTVVVVGRSPEKTRAVASGLGVDSYIADFRSLDDVARLAAELNAAYPYIDVFANNAGGVFGTQTKTANGFEQTFQINHLAPFLLTRLLLEKLIASKATIIQTSSYVRFAGKINLDDLNNDHHFDAPHVYSAAKLENILFTNELHRRYNAQGIAAASFYPGNVVTNFASQATHPIFRVFRYIATRTIARKLFSTPEQGADQIVWLTEGKPGTDWQSGAYYYKRKASLPANPQAFDDNLARGLWERSESFLEKWLAN
ncbi:MAG: SDR family NAD(P)-dependent oxidoreductase [Anaerolineae bacterium]